MKLKTLLGRAAGAAALAVLALAGCSVDHSGPGRRQADPSHRLPDLPQRRPDRQEQQVAGRGAARLQHQVGQVRLRRRRQHRVHRQGTGLRCARVQPRRARLVGTAEHPVQRRVRARRRRRQRGAGGPQRHRASTRSPTCSGKRVGTPFASTAHYSLLAALAQNGLSPNGCSADRPAAAGHPGGVGARRYRRRLYVAADAGPAAQDRQGPDHQPPAGQGRQADAGPRPRCRTSSPQRTPRSSTPGVSSRPGR